ncbi:phosphatidylinositol 4,5-bisphosphate 5-phosphatase A isoform X3 [Puntigrus tetrazona]|uniref:phosphatidylinositol 4,5-bisphosphate 5-phosphatase A isoform X3 n=1 Tax=Puntigrus tetrazona TaxID=1606681 RepID=UPI001C89A594|nr:phosphatidylinositol 4,5-bisphosphate 5-phosphatase A isoform X3 [Puntigrus tetrazona]
MDPMQPIQSCSIPEEQTGFPGLKPVPALLGNPCKVASSSHCQMVMTGNPPTSGQTPALQTNSAVQERTRPDSTTQSTKSISISRPRPAALGTKTSIKVSRSNEPSLQVKVTGMTNFLLHSPAESPLPYYSPQKPLSPTPQLGFNPPTLPSPPSQHARANTHNNLIARPIPIPNPSPSSNPIPQPIPSPEAHVSNTGDTTEKKLNKTISEEGDFRVHIVTWNVGSGIPPDDITSLFGSGIENGSTDMVVVGLQEVNSMINKRLKDALFIDQWSELCMDTLSRFGYVLLNMAKKSESVLEGFSEGPLNFPPTYKFDVGTHTYDTSAKKRKPAWTDRILWRLRRTGSPVPSHNSALQRGLTSWLGGATRVSQHFYRSHMGFTISDHKPVSALFSLHFPFKVNLPLVTLEVEKEWTKFSDATVKLSLAHGFQRSSWDWVGLYKVGCKHHKDYAAYVWAKSEHSTQVTFSEEDLPRDPGEYILGYYSNNTNSIVGVTEPFQVQLPLSMQPAPACQLHSDSSDISSEDDSTLVLLAPSSRSPSPGNHGNKRHHQKRQRSRSPAVPALSGTPLSSLQSLSLCPRPRDGPARSSSPRPLANAKKERLVSPDTLTSPSLSPLSPRSPVSPVSAPEALIAAILGEPRPPQIGKAGDVIL